MLEQGYRVLITHGNGPQVDNLMIMADKAAIMHLVEQGYMVITGRGKILVYHYEKGFIEGIDCVIDKDLASMEFGQANPLDRVVITDADSIAAAEGRSGMVIKSH